MKLDPAMLVESDPEPDAASLPPQSRNVPKPRRGGGPKNPARKRDVALRVDEIIRLRVMGKTWNEVAASIGYTRNEAAKRAFREYIQRIPAENAAELRAIENARYDALTAKLWPACMNLDYDAIDRFVRISQQRRALNGIDLEPKLVLDMAGNGLPQIGPSDDERVLALRTQLEQLEPGDREEALAALFRLRLVGSPASGR